LKTIPFFSEILLDWFEANQRSLPWRGETDPYKIWVSEIILQQTRVNQGYNYYTTFIKRFPDLNSLAEANLQEVLHVWQGLGYYSRARNMHAAAQQISVLHQGIFPKEYREIRKLKGIGEYTAAAVSSIAFNRPFPAVDGNVMRVISRLFDIFDDISQQKTRCKITKLCKSLINKENPGDFNQALMELGAIQCTPKNPKCETCPFANYCLALEKEHTPLLPFKSFKPKIRQRFFHYFILIHKSKIIIEQRIENDIWKNLYQFPLIETTLAKDMISKKDISMAGLGEIEPLFLKEVKHKLTHQHLTLRFYLATNFISPIKKEWKAISIEDFKNYPFPAVLHDLLLYLQSESHHNGCCFLQ